MAQEGHDEVGFPSLGETCNNGTGHPEGGKTSREERVAKGGGEGGGGWTLNYQQTGCPIWCITPPCTTQYNNQSILFELCGGGAYLYKVYKMLPKILKKILINLEERAAMYKLLYVNKFLNKFMFSLHHLQKFFVWKQCSLYIIYLLLLCIAFITTQLKMFLSE